MPDQQQRRERQDDAVDLEHERDAREPATNGKAGEPYIAQPGFREKPFNVEAEQALLGAILINNQAYREVSAFLTPAHFWEPVHGRIYAAVQRLITTGRIADYLTLKFEFDHDEALRELDGAQYLGNLARLAETVVNAADYGRMLLDLATRRALIEIGEELVNRAYDPRLEETGPALLEQHRGLVEQLRDVTNAEALGRIAYADLAALAQPVPPERFVVDRWVPVGYLTSLYGTGGSGKSFLALMMAVAVALGQPWLGYGVEPRSVLCFMAEDDHNELLRRLARICAAFKADCRELIGRVHLAPRLGKLNGLMHFPGGVPTPTPLYQELRDNAVDMKCGLVIVDNAAQTYGGNELDRGQVTAFCNALVGISQAIDGGVLMLGHPSGSTGREYSGSTAWNSVPRSRVWFETGDEKGEYVLTLKKTNQSEPFGLRLRMNEQTRVVEPDGQIEATPTAKPAGKRGPKSKADKTIALLEQLYETHRREIAISELISEAIRRGIVARAPDAKALGNREATIRDHLNAFPHRVDFRTDDTVTLKPA